MTDCFFCDPENFGSRKLNLEDEKGFWYLAVPDSLGSYGQLLFIIKKLVKDKEHIKDITDPMLLENRERLTSVMEGISRVSKQLTLLEDECGRHVEKVYVLSQCEHIHHLHFHLIPRYECDPVGNEFLYRNELEEARWQDVPKKDPKQRMEEGTNILQSFKTLLENEDFFYPKERKQTIIEDIVKTLNKKIVD